MSPDAPAPSAPDELRFDRAIPLSADAAAEPARATVVCASCRTTLETEYFTVGGAPHCAACKTAAERQAAPVTEWGLVLRALAFGFGAAVVGAAIHYGVIAITELEIGIVAG